MSGFTKRQVARQKGKKHLLRKRARLLGQLRENERARAAVDAEMGKLIYKLALEAKRGES